MVLMTISDDNNDNVHGGGGIKSKLQNLDVIYLSCLCLRMDVLSKFFIN
jgi:hypothetical protein